MSYKVFVDDNFHYMDIDERYELGAFDTLEAAVEASKKIVDTFLADAYEPGIAASSLYEKYVMFGEDPFVIGSNSESIPFRAWDYAKSRCEIICAGAKATPTKPATKDGKPTNQSDKTVVDMTEQDSGQGFMLGCGERTQPSKPTTSTPVTRTGIEVTVVSFRGHLTVLKTDHDRKRLGAWSLIDGKWVEADPHAFWGGRMIGDSVPESPPLPAW